MALDADGHGDAVAGVDDARVLTRADEHPRALGGQAPQVQPGRLVGAVLAPHHRVQRQLEVVGLAAQDLADGLELVVGQPEGPVQRLPRRWLVGRQRLGRGSHGALHDRGRAHRSRAGGAGSGRDGRPAGRRGPSPATPRSRRGPPRPASAAGRPPSRGGRARGSPASRASAGSTGITTSPSTKRPPGRSAPRDAGEQRRLPRALEVVDGQRRDDQVEGAGGQRVGEVGHRAARLHRRPRRARAASSMASSSSTPTAVAPPCRANTAASVAPVPVPEVEHPGDGDAPARRGDRLLEAPVGGHLGGHQLGVGRRVEVKLSRRRHHGESSASRRTQVQRSTNTERPRVTRLIANSIRPLPPLPHTPCWRS